MLDILTYGEWVLPVNTDIRYYSTCSTCMVPRERTFLTSRHLLVNIQQGGV